MADSRTLIDNTLVVTDNLKTAFLKASPKSEQEVVDELNKKIDEEGELSFEETVDYAVSLGYEVVVLRITDNGIEVDRKEPK